jgi:predicted ABC-class ATPase
VTLIVGGGFHGKTTLLKAVECGIYNKVHPGAGGGGYGWNCS